VSGLWKSYLLIKSQEPHPSLQIMGQRLQTKITHCVPLYFPRLYTQYESWPRRWTFKLTLWYGALALNLPWMYRSTRLVFPPYSFPRRTTFKSTFPAMAVKYGSWPWQESIQLVAVIGKKVSATCQTWSISSESPEKLYHYHFRRVLWACSEHVKVLRDGMASLQRYSCLFRGASPTLSCLKVHR